MSDTKTVKQASTMLCPIMGGGKCVGDKCMGWRWFDRPHQYARTTNNESPGDAWEKAPFGHKDGVILWRIDFPLSARKGFCGMPSGEAKFYSDKDPFAVLINPTIAPQLQPTTRPYTQPYMESTA